MRVIVRPIPATALDADVALLDADERARIATFVRPRDAAAWATGRATLRRALGERLGIDPASVPLVAPEGAPPRVEGSSLACSVTHGQGLVAVAVSDGKRVGIDLESAAGVPRDELAGIARDVLRAPDPEVAAIRRSRDGRIVFLRRWTLVEAVLKALGTGLAADPALVRFAPGDDPRHPSLASAPGVSGAAAGTWSLTVLDAAHQHVLAVAADGDAASPDVEWGS